MIRARALAGLSTLLLFGAASTAHAQSPTPVADPAKRLRSMDEVIEALDRLKVAQLRGAGKPGKGKAAEADLEGSARVGDLIYWIASHGRDSNGRRQPHRLRFFATPIRQGRPVVPEV